MFTIGDGGSKDALTEPEERKSWSLPESGGGKSHLDTDTTTKETL